MKTIKDPKKMYLYSFKMKHCGKSIGLVPTMGFLHEGHLSLIKAAKRKSDIVVVSIFVNPAQFAPGEDLSQYPRNLKRDKRLLKKLGVDVLFSPNKNKMYQEGFDTLVETQHLSRVMCGRFRPNHFRGVTTVVAKLFNIISPDYAFFGEKDYQQLVIIKKMVKDLNFPAKIVSLPIIREFDGLAMSSRNKYLTPKERKSATILYQSLSNARNEIKEGVRDLNKILLHIRSMIKTAPVVKLEYITIVDPETLAEKKKLKGSALIALAARIGKARLIDNIMVEAK